MSSRSSVEDRRATMGKRLWPRNTGGTYFYYLLVLVAVVAFVYYLYSYRQLALVYLPSLLVGTLVTLIISVLSAVIAIILGLIGARARLSRFGVIREIAVAYVEIVRGTPLLVQLLLWYFGVGTILSNAGFNPYDLMFQVMTLLQSNSLVPTAFNGFFYGIIGLSFNYGAYLTEVFRSGILSVEKGQMEAALSLGLDTQQSMRRIILPQAVRVTIPALTNNFITLI